MSRFCKWVLVWFVLMLGTYSIRLAYVYLVRPIYEDKLTSLNKCPAISEDALYRILNGIPADTAKIIYAKEFARKGSDFLVVRGLFNTKLDGELQLFFVLCREHGKNWSESRVFRLINDLPPMISESGTTNPLSYTRLHELTDDYFWEVLYEVTDESGGVEWISPIIKDGDIYGPAPLIRERGWWRNDKCGGGPYENSSEEE